MQNPMTTNEEPDEGYYNDTNFETKSKSNPVIKSGNYGKKLNKIEMKLPTNLSTNLSTVSKNKILTRKMSKQNANDNYSYIVSDDLKIIVQPIIPKNSSKTIYDIIMANIKKEQEIIKSKTITRKYIHDYSKPFINID